jgi:2'-5' RNA ligase
MATIRTFVAVTASQRVNNNVGRVIERLAACLVDYNWVLTENLHITLNYVGDVVDVEVPELCKLIQQSAQNFAPFEMSLQGVGGFPNINQPRTLWMGVDEGADCLRAINKNVEEVLSQWGVNKDRNEFVPHMTLGRLRRGGRWNDQLLEKIHRLRNHDGGFCTVDRIIVYSSYLDRSGPTYTAMATISLQG